MSKWTFSTPRWTRWWLALGVLPLGALAELPDLGDARVNIPYSELKTLWEAARKEPPAKPVPAAVLSARYRIDLRKSEASGVAEIELQTFQEDWVTLPLLGAEAQLERIEPAGARVFLKDGRYVFLGEGVGWTSLKLHFGVPLAGSSSSQSLKLTIPPAAVSSLVLGTVPEGKQVQVRNATQSDAAQYRLPASGTLELEVITPAPAPVPSRWRTETQALAELADGRLQYRARVTATADSGSGLSLELKLPPGARVTEVTGDDLARWTFNDRLRLEWPTRDLLRREFDVIYTVPHSASAGTWNLQTPEPIEGEPGENRFAMVVEKGLELQPKTDAPTVPSRWLAGQAAGRPLVLAGRDGVLEARWLPLVETSPASIGSVQATMRIVGDGSLLNELVYVLQHPAPLGWQLQLPAGSQLLGCSVNGTRTNPVDRGENKLEIMLSGPGEKSEVRIAYTERKPAFKPVAGQLAVELPRTALLIHRLDWTLQLPAGYELSALEGNVQAVHGGHAVQGSADSKGAAIRLQKELCKDETPRAELFYQKP